MKEHLIKTKSKTKMMVYLLLILVIISSIILGVRVLPSISFGAEDTQKILVEGALEKYINYSISDQDKGTLVQYNVKEKIEYGENYIPAKNSEVVLQLSQIDGKYPYEVKTITKSTAITNGKTSGIEENCAYDVNAGTVTLRANNQNEQGELIYQDQPNQNAVDEYIIICYYDTYAEGNPERDLTLTVSAKSTLSTQEGSVINADSNFEIKVTENIGTLTSTNYQTEDIYNGYIKSNKINGTDYNTQYKEIEQILVSKKEAQEKLEVLENNTFVSVAQNQKGEEVYTDLGNNHNLVYKSTKIAKESLVKLLGEDGILEILDANRNVMATINKDTQFDEDGTITINYENEPEVIILRTSKIQNEGILSVEHTKEIKNTITDVTSTKIKTTTQTTGIYEEVSKTENDIEETVEKQKYVDNYENIVGFQEAKTNASISLSNTEWTNKQQNEVTFDISLNANTIKDNMFKNPSLRIELPSEVEKVILQNSGVFYANGLELQDPYLETNENGNIVIVANLVGAQTAYSGNALELTTDVRITATIILKKDIETTQANANLVYTNQYTLDGSVETGSQPLALQIESYQEEQAATVAEENVATYSVATATPANVEGLKLEVAPVKGETDIKDGDTVYEGEYIKYNVKVTNTSDETMNGVKIVGGVPEGTTYGELVADYYTSNEKYYYNFDNTVKSKGIEIGTLKAGESVTKFYEVQVNDLAEGQDEKKITTNINAYVGGAQAASYELTNLVKPAEVSIFLGGIVGTAPDQWLYELTVSSDEAREVAIDLKAPKLFDLDYITILGQGDLLDLENVAKVSEDNIITLNVNTNQTYIIGGYIDSSAIAQETDGIELELVATAKAKLNDITYQSNETRILVGQLSASISMTSSNEGEEVEYGDEIDYEITITNTGRMNIDDPNYLSVSVNITDFLPENVEPISMTYSNWEEKRDYIYEDEEIVGYYATGNYNKLDTIEEDISGKLTDGDGNNLPNVDLNLLIPYGESVTINVKTTAGLVYEKTKVENSATVTGANIVAKTSNIITHTILPYNYEEPVDEPDSPDTPDSTDSPDTPDEPNNPSTPINPNEKYSISGVVWLDENEDGQRQTGEKTLNGITAMVVDTKDATIVKDKVQTGSDGTYRFSDLDKGDYVVLFQYDTNTYRVTEYQKNGVASSSNSDAVTKEVTANGETMKAGVIEVSNLEASVSNMDIGLVENKICDFKLDKSITKVTVTTNSETKQYSYNNEKLAKIEIKAKEIQGATVIIEYKIVITNEGELASTVGKVIDYLPEGLTFSSELNKNWSAGSNGQLINTSLSNQKIEPGQSLELTLVATKTMTSNSTGTFTNAAEIGDITNSLGIADTDSTPGNKVKAEDDYSEAAVILSVSTGIFMYISIGLLLAVLVAVAVFLAHKYDILKIGKISLFGAILVVMLLAGTGNVDAAASEAYFTPDFYGTTGHTNIYGPDWFFGSTPSVGDGYCANPGAGWHKGLYDLNYFYKDSYTKKTTNRDDISFTMKNNPKKMVEMQFTNDDYLFGPFEFNCSYDGGYNLEVKDANKKLITNYTIYDANKNKITKLSGTGNIKFYLKIPVSSCSNGIASVQVSTSRSGYKTTTTKYFAEANYNAGFDQTVRTVNSLLRDEKTKKTPIRKTKNVTWTNINGALEIVKQDTDKSNKKLKGVEFKIKAKNGKYLRVNNKGSLSGSITVNSLEYKNNAETATTFKTNSSGKIVINNLPAQTYTIEEVSNPNYGYKVTASGKKVRVREGRIITKPISNTKQTGNLIIEKKDKDTGTLLEGMGFKIKNAKGKYIIAVDNNQKTQTKVKGKIHLSNLKYTTDESKATEFITDRYGKIAIYNLLTGTYNVIETSVGDKFDGYEVDDKCITWTANGKNGKGKTATVTVSRQKSMYTEGSTSTKATTVTINNQKKYVKLSGYVWVDDIDIIKLEDKDSLYDTSKNKDLLFNGITVRLKDKTTGNIVKDENGNNMETTTSQLNRYTENNGNGEYLFDKVLINDLDNYYIEFEYDGLTYTNAIKHIEEPNGSKAEESDSDRTTFNEKFSIVEGDSKDTGHTTDAKGNKGYDLKYDKSGKETTLISDGSYEIKTDSNGNEYMQQNSVGAYTITADTTTEGYSIKEQYEKDKKPDEIRYINLGLYKRDQPDISLEKDLYNVKISVNGKDHIYKYASRFKNAGVYEDGFNVGVEFGDETSEGKTSYPRAIYKADYEYDTDSDKELKVYVTYQLLMINQSSSLTAQINSIADYYDSRYTIVNIGTGLIDEDGNTTNGDIAHLNEKGKLIGNNGGIIDIEKYNNKYSKIIINNETQVSKQKAKSIYVQFQLSRDKVEKIISLKGEKPEGELLKNVAEINSYSIYDNKGKIYAGIDTDSNPGNCVPGDENNYEDDTAKCPGLQLEVAAEREMTGTVFVDSTSGELKTGQIRQGNGQYDAGETGIDGVEVTLIENSGSGRVYKTTTETTTEGKGNFKITGYIPGDYTLTYTWGGQTYTLDNKQYTITVQDYKGTVYDETRYKSNQDNKYWYKEETRYTDAIDNYNTDQEAPKGSRLQIDKEMSNTTELTRTKMDSTTPTMGISVEYENDISDWKEKHTFSIKNIDFGIVERARQVLEVSKDVTGVKITLANGQVIVDAKIENGELKGTTAGVTYGPSDSTSKGFVKVEMDNELIQGATIQIEYTVTVANKSELDYDSEDYYKYGVEKGNVITMKPTGLYDYLDSEMVLDENNNKGSWTTVNEDKKLENKTILSTENLKEEIIPGNGNSVKLYTSKVLANTDEIDLNNDFEVTEIKRTQNIGRMVDVESSHLYDQAERVTVTPPTGDDNNYLPYIILGITSFIILGAGVVFIKKKVLR